MARKKIKQSKLLRQVGLWATIWWAVSCLYVLLVFWQGKNLYIDDLLPWNKALTQSFSAYTWLWWLLAIIIIVWIIGAFVWVKALKQSKISLQAGLKDLFLTLR